MGKFATISIAIFLVYLISPAVSTKLNLGTYSFTAVLPRDEVINFEERVHKNLTNLGTDGFLLFGIELVHAFNVTSKNLTTNTISFNITWRQLFLKRYGTPVDVGELAIDIHVFMIRYGGFKPYKFRLNARAAPPVALVAKVLTKHSMTVVWQHPLYFDIDAYHVEMKNGSRNATWENVMTLDGSRTETKFASLNKATMYHIRIDSSNRYGRGELKSKILSVRTKGDEEGGPPLVIIIVVVVAVIVVLLVVVVGFYLRQKQTMLAAKNYNPYEDSLPGVLPTHIYISDNRTYCTTIGNINNDDESTEKPVYFSWNEIPRDHLTTGDVLGEGEFGMVQKATWAAENVGEITDSKYDHNITVAIKTVKDIATSDDRRELFKELKLMAELEEHSNIVNLVGACSHQGPLWVVVEFCENGNLLDHIKQNRNDLTENDQPFTSSLRSATRLKFAYDVSKGMSYLEEKKIIHRDLAARNVLLHGENNTAKVSDFGLSRDIYEIGLYQKTTGGKLPVKWMAIESLQEATYTSKSDVWSFGVLFWEIETAGMLPYGGIRGLELATHLQRGYRLSKPPITTPEIYGLMKKCWELNPDDRPSFQDLTATLDTFVY